MDKKEIRAAAMKASKDYGYDWVMAEFEYEDGEECLKIFKKEMKEEGSYQVCIFGGEEPYYALNGNEVDGVDLYDVMEDGDIFNESEVYKWITLGRMDAWKELLGRKVGIGYFCDGYRSYVFSRDRINVYSLKQRGEVVLEEAY